MRDRKTKPRSKIRIKQSLPDRFENLSRRKALARVAGHVRENPTHPEALHLIELFNLDGEELAEAGVPYETLKVLEKKCLMIGRFH
jgi:hypothetical protein